MADIAVAKAAGSLDFFFRSRIRFGAMKRVLFDLTSSKSSPSLSPESSELSMTISSVSTVSKRI
jgi:hypothetical protein